MFGYGAYFLIHKGYDLYLRMNMCRMRVPMHPGNPPTEALYGVEAITPFAGA